MAEFILAGMLPLGVAGVMLFSHCDLDGVSPVWNARLDTLIILILRQPTVG
jgi:hypothetical protein